MNTIKFSSAVSIDKGKVRTNNEDNFYFNTKYLTAENRDEAISLSESIDTGDALVYGVFDGMGGEALGEEASLVAAQTVEKYHLKINVGEYRMSEKIILKSINEANAKICNKIIESGEKRIGTTFSALYISDDRAKVVNVGDSRVYMLRDGKLIQISIDDTTVQRLVSMGILTKEKARNHEDRHKLSQHLGIFQDEMTIEPHISEEIVVKKGDKFLLCSDGLTDMVDDAVIEKTMRKNIDSVRLSEELVKLALENGGKDNVTAMVIIATTNSHLPKGKSVAKNKRKNKRKNAGAIVAVGAVIFGMAAAFAALKLINMPRDDTIQAVTVSKIYFSDTPEKVPVGEKNFLTVNIEPANVNDGPVFSTSDSGILSIGKSNGYYEALKPGSVTVKAALGKLECTTNIEVYDSSDDLKGKNEGVIAVEDITVPKEIDLYVGEEKTIDCRFFPDSANEPVYYFSADTDIAEISKDGVLTGKSVGTTAVSVSCPNVVKTTVIDVKAREDTEKQRKNSQNKHIDPDESD